MWKVWQDLAGWWEISLGPDATDLTGRWDVTRAWLSWDLEARAGSDGI